LARSPCKHSMDQGLNKSRKDTRAVVTLTARYRSPNSFEFLQDTCCDVSLGGMFIRSQTPAPAGTLLKLECETDDESGGGVIRGIGRVVWLRSEADEYGPSGMGVKFVKLEPGSSEVITRMVQDLTDAGMQEPAASASEMRARVHHPADLSTIKIRPSTAAQAPQEPQTEATNEASSASGEGMRHSQALSSAVLSVTRASELDVTAITNADLRTDHDEHTLSTQSDYEGPAEVPPKRESGGDSPRTSDIEHSWFEHGHEVHAVHAAPPPKDTAISAHVGSSAVETQRIEPRYSDTYTPRYKNRTYRHRLIICLVLLGLFAIVLASWSTSEETKSSPPPANPGADHDRHEPVTAETPTDQRAPEEAQEQAKPSSPDGTPQNAHQEDAEQNPERDAERAADSAHTNTAAQESAGAAPTPEADRAGLPYILTVRAKPEGTKVIVDDRELIAPGDLTFSAAQLPDRVRVRAEKDGYRPSATWLERSSFKLEKDGLRRRVYFKLQPLP